jgi:hypothetical protein
MYIRFETGHFHLWDHIFVTRQKYRKCEVAASVTHENTYIRWSAFEYENSVVLLRDQISLSQIVKFDTKP